MSKCKPGGSDILRALAPKGVVLEDTTDRISGTRYVVIKIPYEILRDDPDTQRAFQDLVTITTED